MLLIKKVQLKDNRNFLLIARWNCQKKSQNIIFVIFCYIVHKLIFTRIKYHIKSKKVQQSTVSVSNIRDNAFCDCSEIIRTRSLTIFTVHANIFGQFTAAFHFSKLRRGNRSLHVGTSEKV